MVKFYNLKRSTLNCTSNFVKGQARDKNISFFSWRIFAMFLFTMLYSFQGNAQTTYYSKASATDFNDVNSWGTATDGTGAAPGVISNADNFVIQNASTMSLTGNAAVRRLTITSGSLTVPSNTLTVSIAAANNTVFTINGGTLNLNGGTIAVNGNVVVSSGTFNQSGGDLRIDPNSGVAGTSVASGTASLLFSVATGTVSGGTITIVDPNFNASGKAVDYNVTTNSSTWSVNHTLQLGDGISTDTSSNTSGFILESYTGSGKLLYGKLKISGGNAANRWTSLGAWSIYVAGSVTVDAGSELRLNSSSTSPVLSGDIVNDGILTSTVNVTFGGTSGTATVVNTNAQMVSGTGIFRNLTTAPTANFTSITIQNNNVAGVTFPGTTNIASQPTNAFSISGTLTFTAGKVFTSGGASVVLGNATPSAGTLSYTAGGFASGVTFGRWFTAAGTGTSFASGADATNTTSRFPFVDSFGQGRSAWIERVAPVTASGVLAVVYNNVAGTTSGVYTDGGTPLDIKANDYWTVSALLGTPTSATSFKIQMVAPGIFSGTLATASTRVVRTDGTFVGTHEAGTTTPGGHRIGLTPAELTTGSYTLATNNADIPFASIASGGWNVNTTWNKGVVPTCTDVVTISAGTTVTSNSAANVARNVTISSGGTLISASGDLVIGCTLNNNFLTNNGTLTVSGGTLTINGNLMNNAGSTFNQSGGDIFVDGSDGVTANSVATGTPLVRVTASAPSNLNWTGGTLTIVDPHFGTSTTDYALSISQGGAANAAGTGHTVKFGNGVSTTAGGHTNGFYAYLFPGSFYYSLGNMIVDASTGTNRVVKYTSAFGILGDLTVTSGVFETNATSSLYVAGNIVNNSTINNLGTIQLARWINAAAAASTTAQSVSGSGVFQNLSTAPTANLTSLTVNNSNAAGVTLNVPLSVSGTLTLTQGFINTTNANLLTLGTVAAAGTLTGGSATAYVKGPFARTIASGNASSNYITYPVGKSVYNPVFLAPATTSVSVMKAEAFDTNAGTTDASIMSLSSKRWEAPIMSGTVTNINVRLGDAAIVAANIPVQAISAAGIYSSSFGSVATYAAGTPNTITSNTPLASGSYTGYLSYATSNICSGTPTPGATTTTATTICLGGSVTLGVTTIPAGSGVTFQWQSSPDGITYTNIPTATANTYVATPTATTYYQCVVTCSAGPASGTSTPVQITFTNNITATTPATRCGTGTVNLAATASSGTINWYAAASGGSPVGTGSSFTTPSISTSTTYYAAAEGSTNGMVQLGTGITTTGTTNLSAFNNYRSSAKVQLIYTASELQSFGLRAGNITSIAFNVSSLGSSANNTNYVVNIGTTALATFSNTTFLTPTFTTCYGPSTYTHTASGWQTINFTTPYNWDGVSNLVLEISHDGIDSSASADTYYTATTGNTVLYSYNNSTLNNTLSTNRFNVQFSGQIVCSSPRVSVTATVNTPPTLTLSTSTVSICNGTSSSAVTLTTGGADYDTYVWSPATNVTGNSTSGWVFNPSATTTYTLTASQSSGSLCSTSTTVTVTVNPLPTAISISPSPVTVCEGVVQALTSSGGASVASGSNTIGADTTVTTQNGLEPTAFNNRYEHYWMQMVFTAAELNAAGVQAGNINGVKFNITTIGSATSVSDYRVYMGTTASSTLTAYVTSGLSEVFAAATYSQQLGVNTITFNTPYNWDGVSNIVLDIRSTGADSTNNSSTYYTATADNKTITSVTSTTFASSNAYVASNPTGTLSLKRLNTTFDWTSNVANPITWSPTTNLYTDVSGTVPYTGTNASTVYFKSNTVGTTSYTATATSVNTCTQSASVSVTVTTTVAPTGTSPQTFNAGQTLADLVVTGSNIVWYASASEASSATNPLPSSTPLVDNTTYYATQTVSGCPSTASLGVLVQAALNTNGFDLTKFKFYPNPVHDVLNIDYAQNISKVEVYNAVGQLVSVRSQSGTSTKVNMSGLSDGVYLIKLSSENTTQVIRVVKN